MNNILKGIEIGVENTEKWAKIFQTILVVNGQKPLKDLQEEITVIKNDQIELKLKKREASVTCCAKKSGFLDLKLTFEVDDLNTIVKKLQDLKVEIQNYTFDPGEKFHFVSFTGPESLQIRIFEKV